MSDFSSAAAALVLRNAVSVLECVGGERIVDEQKQLELGGMCLRAELHQDSHCIMGPNGLGMT